MSTADAWALSLPVPVEFGSGALEKLPAYLPGLRRALVVTGRQAMKKAGVTDRLGAVLDSVGIEHTLFDELSAEPEHTEIEAAGERARAMEADVIVGCGGGSAMDAAGTT